MIGLWARSVDAVVATTVFTTAGLAVVIELPYLLRRADAPAVVVRRSMQALWAMVGLCVVATGVRLATSRGLWVDEAISVDQAQMPFGQMLADMRTTDVHPPLHHAVLWVTVRLFGTSEVAVRLPSLLAGVALVPVMFWVGRTLYDRRTGWIAAILAAIAPFCVWYSQEARMYSQFMLFAAVAIGAQVLALRRGRWYDWGLYAVSTALLFWTQYFGIMPILVQQAAFGWAIWQARRDRGRGARASPAAGLLSALVIVVLILPMVPILQAQLAAYGNRGVGLAPSQAGAGSSVIGGTISIYAVGANLIWAFLGYHADGPMVQIAALWPLLMLLAFVMLGRGRSGPSLLLLGLVAVPMGTLFAIGSLRNDLFELRYFSGAVPAMLLLAARVVTATTVRRAAVVVAGCVLTAVMVVGLVDQQLNGANPRLYDFKGAFDHIAVDAEPGDLVVYEPNYLSEVVDVLRPRPRVAAGQHADPRRHDGVGRRDREGARREELVGEARHAARRSRTDPHGDRPRRRSRTSPSGDWRPHHDAAAHRSRRPAPAAADVARRAARHAPSAVRATRAGARQHRRPRRLLPLAAAARTASATRSCSGCCSSPSCSTCCRRSGSGGRA